MLAEVDPVTLVVTIIEVAAALGIVWLAWPRRPDGDTPRSPDAEVDRLMRELGAREVPEGEQDPWRDGYDTPAPWALKRGPGEEDRGATRR